MLLSDLKRSLRGSRSVTGKVSFTTADGKRVEFTPGPRKLGKMNAYASYVRDNIQAFLDDGMAAPAAMVAVAKKYRAGKR